MFRAVSLPAGIYQALMQLNFRRSGLILYRPACEHCKQCQNIRVPVEEFRPNRAQRRVARRNRDLTVTVGEPKPTDEKHQLYRRYLQERHDRQMGDSWVDFCGFLYESPVKTIEVEYRAGEQLVGVGLVDVEPAAMSTVYFYYEPHAAIRSLGIFNILCMIECCRTQCVPHLYLGYYIRDCRKMNYKANFKPCEVLDEAQRWQRLN